jgi:hypothetical protein
MLNCRSAPSTRKAWPFGPPPSAASGLTGRRRRADCSPCDPCQTVGERQIQRPKALGNPPRPAQLRPRGVISTLQSQCHLYIAPTESDQLHHAFARFRFPEIENRVAETLWIPCVGGSGVTLRNECCAHGCNPGYPCNRRVRFGLLGQWVARTLCAEQDAERDRRKAQQGDQRRHS